MKEFLYNHKLIVKFNIITAIAAVSIILMSLVFYYTTDKFIAMVQNNNQIRTQIRNNTNTIATNLKKLDFITIKNSLHSDPQYTQEASKLYNSLLNKIHILKKSTLIAQDKELQETLKKLEIRIKGYKIIVDSLAADVQEDSEDGLYSILALSSTSQKISHELEHLNSKIDTISKRNLDQLNHNIRNIKMVLLAFVVLLFLFLLYTNQLISSSVISKINILKEEILSFFDLLSHKRKDIIHLNIDGKDEISDMANIINEHLYIAEDILKAEREKSEEIKKKVEEATHEIRELNKEIEATQRELVFRIGAIAEERSKETGHHVKRVAEYSLILARIYGLSLEESLLIKNASPMHDIGKIGIPDAVLKKPGKFTDEEFTIMKSHAEVGYKMLKHSKRSILKAASILAYQHHERWDGKGYPQGLKGEEIHIYGRITAIADVFDALGSDRVYKQAWPLSKIVALFEEERGKQFDPELVDLFLDNIEHFLAAKEMIESQEDNYETLSKYIENFNTVADKLNREDF